jgi:hypothetical protein
MISMRAFPIAAGLSTVLALPVWAQANLGGMITGNDIERVRELAAAYGPAERRQDEQGTWIRGEMDEIVYSISFLNCDDSGLNCSTVQFRAWWETNGAHTMEAMNQWNRDRRFSAAYLDDSMNATIEWDVNLAGGVTAVNFDDSLQWWQAVVRQFRDSVVDPGYGAEPDQGGPSSPGK